MSAIIEGRGIAAGIRYYPETGQFTRLRGKSWRPTGTRDKTTGYCRVFASGRLYYAHRLAWFMAHGEFPPADVDHINADKSDNRLANLRPATRSQNQAARRPMRTNTSGAVGVSWYKNARKWNAAITRGGVRINLGYFADIEDAKRAYADAADKAFKEFSPTRHGGPHYASAAEARIERGIT